MNELLPKTCLNCAAETSGAFCISCGQPTEVKRLRFRTVISEFVGKVIGLDSAFLRTLIQLFMRPGQVAMSYIQGNRRKYMGPVAYFLLITTIYILVVNLLDIDWMDYVENTVKNMTGNFTEADRFRMQEMMLLSNRMQRVIAFLNAFFFAIPLWLIFRKEGKINFMEALTASLYIGAQSYVLNTLSIASFSATGHGFQWVVTVGSVLLPCWLAATMFTKRVSWANFFKGLVSMILTMIVVVIVVAGFMVLMFSVFGERAVEILRLESFIESQ